MDPTSCPAGIATDNILRFDGQIAYCEASYYTWIILASILLLYRFFLGLVHFRLWLHKRRAEIRASIVIVRQSGLPASMIMQTRLAIIPTLSLMGFTAQTLLIALTTGPNSLANSTNGYSLLCMGYWLFSLSGLQFMTCFKMVRLGSRIAIGRSVVEEESPIDRFDWPLISMILISVFSLAIAIVLCIVTPLVDLTNRASIRTIFVCAAINQTSIIATVTYQFQRCIALIKQSAGSLNRAAATSHSSLASRGSIPSSASPHLSERNPGGGSPSPRLTLLRMATQQNHSEGANQPVATFSSEAIRKMRQQQVIIAVSGMTEVAIWLVIAISLYFSWYFIIAMQALEGVALTLVILSMIRRNRAAATTGGTSSSPVNARFIPQPVKMLGEGEAADAQRPPA